MLRLAIAWHYDPDFAIAMLHDVVPYPCFTLRHIDMKLGGT